MGSSVALFLARRGLEVTLIDGAAEPFSGASRWNEGKIHLGYLYAGDRSTRTARSVLAGGLSFKPLTEELIGCSLAEVTTPEDDIYLIHRDSVADVENTAKYFEDVTKLVHSDGDSHRYLVDVSESGIRRLSGAELEEIADLRSIVAGFRVPERSVCTQWIADRFVEAIKAEPRIALRLSTQINGIKAAAGSSGWELVTDAPQHQAFEYVVNALWHGRLAVDRAAGLEPQPGWSHRYRVSLFVRTRAAVAAPNAVVATGPFGDIKNYTGRDFYLSWYDAGLLAHGDSLLPPQVPPLDATARREVTEAVIAQLGSLIPAARAVCDDAIDIKVRGGWVFAAGKGSLADPQSTLHQRDAFGIRRVGSYFSVDTGKYSSAPLLARDVADQITREVGC